MSVPELTGPIPRSILVGADREALQVKTNVLGQLSRRRIARIRIFFQRLQNDRIQIARQAPFQLGAGEMLTRRSLILILAALEPGLADRGTRLLRLVFTDRTTQLEK